MMQLMQLWGLFKNCLFKVTTFQSGLSPNIDYAISFCFLNHSEVDLLEFLDDCPRG